MEDAKFSWHFAILIPLDWTTFMRKTISPLLIVGLLAMPLITVNGCADSDTVEIPTNPVPKAPGRPTTTGEGDGTSDTSGMTAPPVDAPP